MWARSRSRGAVQRRASQRREAGSPAAGGALRDQILDLAKETFSTRGYAAASLRDLAERAGVTAAALYYHFEKKEDLLREIIFEGLKRLSDDLLAALAPARTPEQALEALVRAHLRYNADNHREAKIIIEDSRFLNEADYALMREKQNGILNFYRASIRELQAKGRIGSVDATVLAFNIISIILGWYRWFRPSGGVPRDEAFEWTVKFAMAAALGVAPPRPPAPGST